MNPSSYDEKGACSVSMDMELATCVGSQAIGDENMHLPPVPGHA
jgi:hypothetical protein